jgi:cytochrome P450/nitrite reductase/ring-hydroxylating ferredoxin subunit
MHDTQIAVVGELERGNLVGAQVAGVELVVVADENRVKVFEGRCPHQGTLLSEGNVDDGRLVCRGHGWQFDCASGVKVDDSLTRLHQFSLVVDGEKVLVDRAEVAAWAAERKKAEGRSGERPLLTPERLPGPRGLPILGNIHQIKVDKFHLILEEWYRRYGDLYQFKLGPERAVVIAAPEMVQAILQDRPDRFARLSDIRKTIEEMGVVGLFSAEGEQWRRHRHIATRAFDARHLRDFFPTMVKVTQRFHHRWQQLAEQQAPLDVQKELMRYTVDITTNLAFGYDLNTLETEGDRIQQHLERVFPKIAYRAFMPIRYWNYLKLPADRALEASLAELRVSINQFIDRARQQLAENPTLRERPQNLLQALLAAQADKDVEFSDFEISGNVFTFLLAGEDTTANSMAWMMYFMTKYPDVQRQMQAEADAVLTDSVTVTEYDKIRQLRYIEAVAHETMRLKPVAAFLGLQALTDVTIDQLQIPKGTPIFLLLRPKGMEVGEFAAAAEFKPERWLNYARQDNPHQRKSFLPFGAGPRLCPGRSLALLEIKMAVGMICRHFEVVRTEPHRKIDERFVFTMMPQDLMISLRPRRS